MLWAIFRALSRFSKRCNSWSTLHWTLRLGFHPLSEVPGPAVSCFSCCLHYSSNVRTARLISLFLYVSWFGFLIFPFFTSVQRHPSDWHYTTTRFACFLGHHTAVAGHAFHLVRYPNRTLAPSKQTRAKIRYVARGKWKCMLSYAKTCRSSPF